MLGKWLAHTRAERSNVVEDHLGQSIKLFEGEEESEKTKTKGKGKGKAKVDDKTDSTAKENSATSIGKAHFTLAHYTDSLYQGLVAKAESSEWAATKELRKHKERELSLCEQALAHARGANKKAHVDELERHMQVLRRVVEGDRQDSRRLEEDRDSFLTTALSHYIDALLLCDRYDVRGMFRLCSLWFNNATLPTVNGLLRDKGGKIPTTQFLPLIYQITSRMSVNQAQSGFQEVLCALIERVATAHPHHVLYQLFALKNGEIPQAHKGSNKTQFVVDEDKVRAAKDLLTRMQKGRHSQLLGELSSLISAYVELTRIDPTATTGGSKSKARETSFTLPPVMTHLPKFSHVRVTTLPAESQVRVLGFSPTYTLCGGRSAPKIVECIGDDGKQYRQLVKVLTCQSFFNVILMRI